MKHFVQSGIDWSSSQVLTKNSLIKLVALTTTLDFILIFYSENTEVFLHTFSCFNIIVVTCNMRLQFFLFSLTIHFLFFSFLFFSFLFFSFLSFLFTFFFLFFFFSLLTWLLFVGILYKIHIHFCIFMLQICKNFVKNTFLLFFLYLSVFLYFLFFSTYNIIITVRCCFMQDFHTNVYSFIY